MNDLVFQSGQTVLFIGDSITDCGRRQDQEQLGNGYVRKVTELITAKYPHRSISYVNKGIGGDTVEGLESRWTTDVLDIKPDWLSINPNEGTLIDGETASISVTCNSGDYNDGNYNAFVNIASNGGSISLPVEMMINGSLLGDTNGDSTINVLDVIIMVNMILGETEADLNTADINGDGLINVSDAVLLINMILG